MTGIALDRVKYCQSTYMATLNKLVACEGLNNIDLLGKKEFEAQVEGNNTRGSGYHKKTVHREI